MASAEKNSNVSDTWVKNMPTKKISGARYAICVDNREYLASLETFKIYRVLPDKDAEQDGDLRVIDESGEDYLFPADYFVWIDLPRRVVRALNRKPLRKFQHA